MDMRGPELELKSRSVEGPGRELERGGRELESDGRVLPALTKDRRIEGEKERRKVLKPSCAQAGLKNSRKSKYFEERMPQTDSLRYEVGARRPTRWEAMPQESPLVGVL